MMRSSPRCHNRWRLGRSSRLPTSPEGPQDSFLAPRQQWYFFLAGMADRCRIPVAGLRQILRLMGSLPESRHAIVRPN